MTDQEQLQLFRQHVTDALRKIPHSRWYALSEESLDALAYFGIDWTADRVEQGLRFNAEEFSKLMAEVVQLVPALRQDRPSDPIPIPKSWPHPLTGQPLPPPVGPDEEAVLAKRSPELLRLMKDLAEKPYQTVAKLEDEAAQRARLAAIRYGEADVPNNPWITGSLPAQTSMAKTDPLRAQVYKREARPATVPWQLRAHHLGGLGELHKHDPKFLKWANAAHERQRKIAEAEIEASKAAVARAEAQRMAAEKRLAAQ